MSISVASERSSLSRWQFASYAAPAMPLAMNGLIIAVYLPAVYADSEGFGLALGFVGFLVMASRVFDGLTDPVIGFWSDRLRTKIGRRKPFLLIGMPIFMVGLWFLWIPPFEFSEVTFLGMEFNSGYPWMLFTLIIFYIGATIKDVPYSAWGAELSTKYNERTLVMSWREAFSVGGLLVGALTPAIIFFWGYDKPSDAVYFLTWFIIILTPFFVINSVFSVPEYEVSETRKARIPLKESMRVAWHNEPYRKLIIIFLFSTIGAAMTNTLSFFFVKHVLMAGDLYGFYLAPYFISQIVAIPLWFALSRRIGKHRATMVAIGWYALWSCFIPLIAWMDAANFTAFEVSQLLSFLPDEAYASTMTYFEGIPTGKFVFFIAVMCLKGSAIGALSALPYAMAADVIDLDTAQTGKKQGGAYFSIWTMTRKLAYALGLFVGANAAVIIGFDSLSDPINTTNTAATLFGLACLYSVVPALFKFVAIPLLWTYPLTEERLAEIQAEIASNERAAIDDPGEDAVPGAQTPAPQPG